MAWSKVNTKFRKPLNWWYHKILCEIGWYVKNLDGFNMYYSNLKKMISKHSINLYGDKI